MKNIVIILGLILMQSSAYAIDEAMIEQKKEFKYSFSAQSTDVLDISNHYGDIKVVFGVKTLFKPMSPSPLMLQTAICWKNFSAQ